MAWKVSSTWAPRSSRGSTTPACRTKRSACRPRRRTSWRTTWPARKGCWWGIRRPWDRYALDPLEQLQVQKDADARGLEIIGFAHSHPDHPPVPSRFDAEHGWTFYSYLVASVQKGRLREARSWRLDGGGVFQEEPLTETA